jgi:hypothetical protein
MEESLFDDTPKRWSTPNHCRRCHYPMAGTQEACPACHRPARLFSRLVGQRLWSRFVDTLASALGVAQILLILLAGLTVAYYLSPLLLLFPLAALSADPPASRGGKTVSRGRRRT